MRLEEYIVLDMFIEEVFSDHGYDGVVDAMKQLEKIRKMFPDTTLAVAANQILIDLKEELAI